MSGSHSVKLLSFAVLKSIFILNYWKITRHFFAVTASYNVKRDRGRPKVYIFCDICIVMWGNSRRWIIKKNYLYTCIQIQTRHQANTPELSFYVLNVKIRIRCQVPFVVSPVQLGFAMYSRYVMGNLPDEGNGRYISLF